MSEAFARELVAEMEHFGQWSGGSHEVGYLSHVWPPWNAISGVLLLE